MCEWTNSVKDKEWILGQYWSSFRLDTTFHYRKWPRGWRDLKAVVVWVYM